MKNATYSVFVRFRRKRLILKRSLPFDEAVRFAEQARRERIHAKDDVLLVEDATGAIVTDTPPDSGVSARAHGSAGAVRAARDALGLARLIAAAHADRISQGYRAKTRGSHAIAPLADEIARDLEEAITTIVNVAIGSPEHEAAFQRVEQALGRLAELRLATNADELVRLALDRLGPASVHSAVRGAPDRA